MRAKIMLALALMMALVVLFPVVGMASSSPTGTTVTTTTTTTPEVKLETLAPAVVTELQVAVTTFIEQNYPSGTVFEQLMSFDLVLTNVTFPYTPTVNVAGVQVGDNILVVHKKADGTIEYIPATVVANGQIEFTLTSASPMSIIRVMQPGTVTTPVDYYILPQTGGSGSVMPMTILIVLSAAVLIISARAYVRIGSFK